MDPEPRRLKCDLAELGEAFENSLPEMSAYLDLDSGEVIYVTSEIRSELDAIYEEVPEEPTDNVAFVTALERRELPDWMHESVLEADAVERGLGTRYLSLPEHDSREGYRDMEAFIATVPSPGLEQRLWDAIRGRGAFRRFKDVLASTPPETERWYVFKAARLRLRVVEWLATEGIEPIEVTD